MLLVADIKKERQLQMSESEKELFGTLNKLCSCFFDNDQVNKQVEVKIMEIQWLLRGSKNFLDFVPDLESSKLDKLF